MKNDPIAQTLFRCGDERINNVLKFHDDWLHLMKKATGSSGNHQFWEGGYYDHISDCFLLAKNLWTNQIRPLPFRFHHVLYVLYFHDIEKLWKYSGDSSLNKGNCSKDKFYSEELPKRYNFHFEEIELNALKYIHGEGDDYRKDRRVMNELAGFCHAVDVLSARVWHSCKGEPLEQ